LSNGTQGSKRSRLKEKVEYLKLLQNSRRPTYPKKDIDIIIRYHRTLREGLVEEIFEDLLNERHLLTRLERYGQDSKFWE
jgi:hypothetical protein